MTTTYQQYDAEFALRPALSTKADAISHLFELASLTGVGFRHRETERVGTFWALREAGDDGVAGRVALANGTSIGGEGTLVGAALALSPQGRTLALVAVHPNHRGRGIGGALADWLADHAAAMCPQHRDLTLVQRVLASDEDARSLLEARGWRRSCTMLRMERALTEGALLPGDAVRPAVDPTVVVRPVESEREMDALMLADYLAFRESERYDPAEFAVARERWKRRLQTDSGHDPTLWFVATVREGRGEETIAGICLCRGTTVERPGMGWIGHLGVRVPWRRRGIGRALLHAAFAELARRGKGHVGLNVIEGNTAAVTAYEQVGMSEVPALRFDEFELAACAGSNGTGRA